MNYAHVEVEINTRIVVKINDFPVVEMDHSLDENYPCPGEHYQLDIEMSFVEQEDVFKVVETLMVNLFKKFSTKKILFVNRGVDTTRPLSAQNDCFWWGYHNFSQLDKPYNTFEKIVRGYDPSAKENFNDIKSKIVCSLYLGPLSNKKILAGLFNDSAEILDLFVSK